MTRYLCRMLAASIFNYSGPRVWTIQQQLSLIFKREDNKIWLSSAFQILPLYFSQKYVKMFSDSKNIREYLAYIEEKPLERKPFSQIVRQYGIENVDQNVINSQNAAYLQVYLHWLMNECCEFNIYNNDYWLEFIHLENPQKLFAPIKGGQKRVFIYHHGPTNSGKSTAAIQQLKNLSPSQKGIYMAPLRLLAWEFQRKLGNCTLITGQQKQYANSNLISCTIQAANLYDQYSVAVIDEIQMIADDERGWAWTKAILAIKAKRIHLCGDQRALYIISKLLEQSGDILQERRYSRLGKLKLLHDNYEIEKAEPGDCIVNFSMAKVIKARNDLNKIIQLRQKKKAMQLKENVKQQAINQNTQTKDSSSQVRNNYAAIIYGKLPPECRKQQATLFNSGALPYLVATNAIGMGLNLNIRKIIFMNLMKPSKDGQRQLQEHQIQQIAGRAGRGQVTGYVHCTNEAVLKKVKRALATVNSEYGLQLQNIKDAKEEIMDAELQANQNEGQQPKEKNQVFNQLLGRFMTKKECEIKKAVFQLTTNYMVDFRVRYKQMMGIELPILEQIDFLKKYSKLNKLYAYKSTEHLAYIFYLLQKNQYDLRELLDFYFGLSLSIPPRDTTVAHKIRDAHKGFIDSFISSRSVSLPGFLVRIYQSQQDTYQYMHQAFQLQLYYNLMESYVWLANKFEFAFYQIDTAVKIKQFLSNKISIIMRQNKAKPMRVKEQQPSLKKQAQKQSRFRRK